MKNKFKNILISGGAGFIGSNLSLKLIEAGYTITVLDNLSTQIHGQNPEENSPLYKSIQGKVNFIKGDVTNREDWEKAIENQDVIVHFAAETGTGQSMYQIEKYNWVNSYGTALMMDVLVNHPNQIKKFILGSTRAVYGEGKYKTKDQEIVYPLSRKSETMQKGIFELVDEKGDFLTPLPTSEDSKVHPISMYGITKANQEDIVKQVCESIGLDYVILRFQNVYGAGQSMKNPYTGILSVFSTQIMTDNGINIFEDGKPVRDFVEVRDVVEACKRSIELEKPNGQTINVGTGIPTTVLEVAENLVKSFKKETAIEISGGFRLGDIRYNVADLTLMKAFLEFEPKITFEEGVKRFVEWAKQQDIGENNFQQSLDEMKEKGLFIKS